MSPGDLLVWAVLLAAVFVIVLPLVWLFVRRRWLSRSDVTFDCSLRSTSRAPGAGWMIGLARYSAEGLQWYRVFSPSLRPRFTFQQGQWIAGGERSPERGEAVQLFDNHVVLTLEPRAGSATPVELSLDTAAATGLRSWLESALPGRAHYGNTAD